MKQWQCGECGRSEWDEKVSVSVNNMPRYILYFWPFLKERFSLNLPDIEEKFQKQVQEVDLRIDARCHHCGKALCPKHRILIADNAFSIDDEDLAELLLPKWLENSAFIKVKNRIIGFVKTNFINKISSFNTDSLKPKAYHCKKCWQTHHKLSVPENEW